MSHRKGRDYENRTADFLNGIDGFTARRNVMSGTLGGEFDCDVSLDAHGIPYKVEVKERQNMPKYMRDWLGQGDFIAFWWAKTGILEGRHHGSELYFIIPDKVFRQLIERKEVERNDDK